MSIITNIDSNTSNNKTTSTNSNSNSNSTISSSSAKSPKPFDWLTLLQQHSWRVALIVALIAWCIHHATKLVPVPIQGSNTTHTADTMTISGIVWFVVSLLLFNWLRIEIRMIRLRSKLPQGDLGWLLLGNIPNSITNAGSLWYDYRAKYGEFFSTNGFTLHVTAWTPHSISWLWNLERKAGANASASASAGGTNLVEVSWPPTVAKLLGSNAVANTNGFKHKALRRILEPSFTLAATKSYAQSMDTLIQQALEEWATSTTGEYQSSSVFKLLAMRLFMRAAFGQEHEPPLEDIITLHQDFQIWLNGFTSFFPYRIPFTQFHKSMAARDRIRNQIGDLVQQFQNKTNPPPTEMAQQTTLLGRACYGDNPMSLEDLKDNILAIIFAGHDTTFASMGTIIHNLCQYPHVREALREEISQLFPDQDTQSSSLDFDRLKSAPVLNAFLAESWRRDPPAPFVFRKLTQPTNHMGFQLPANLRFNISLKLATWNEDLFPRPHEFQIQRFLPQDHPLCTANTGTTATTTTTTTTTTSIDFNRIQQPQYPIFGGGKHACLGANFAKLELRIFVVRLLQLYHVEERNPRIKHFPVHGWINEFRLTTKSKCDKQQQQPSQQD